MRHPDDRPPIAGAPGDAHPDEGTIHAWLDGELPDAEAAAVERHVAACDACATAVAEARGLIAASSRILRALDDVPGSVLPTSPGSTDVGAEAAAARAERVASEGHVVSLDAARSRRRLAARRAWRSWPARAAALALVAAGSWVVVQRERTNPVGMATDSAVDLAAPRTAMSGSAPVAPEAAQPVGGDAPSGPSVQPPSEFAAPPAVVGAQEDRARQAIARRSAGQSDLAASAARKAAPAQPDSAGAAAGGVARAAEPLVSAAPAPPPPAPPSPAPEPSRAAARFGPPVASAPRALAVRGDSTPPDSTTRIVTGRVVSTTGQGVPGANVAVPTATSVGTDAGGHFRIAVPVDSAALVVRGIGFRTARVPLPVAGDSAAPLVVTLQPEALALNDAVAAEAPVAPPVPPPPSAAAAPRLPPPAEAGCYRVELEWVSMAARDAAARVERTLPGLVRLTDEPAGDGWWRASPSRLALRDSSRTPGSSVSPRWRGDGNRAVLLEWPADDGVLQLRLRAVGERLTGVANVRQGVSAVPVTLRRTPCEVR